MFEFLGFSPFTLPIIFGNNPAPYEKLNSIFEKHSKNEITALEFLGGN